MAAPKGNQHAKGKFSSVISDSLRIAALDKTKEGKAKGRAIAEKLVEMALEGNLQAAQIVLERLEGKAVQQIEQKLETTNMVVRAPDLARNAGEWSQMYAPDSEPTEDTKPN